MKLEQVIQQTQFSSPAEKLVVNLLYTGNWMYRQQARWLKQWGLSPEQYNVLRILKGQRPKPASVNLLMERMLNQASNASRIVEKLRQKGLVNRRECPQDRRRVEVEITPEGVYLLKQIDQVFDPKSFLSNTLSPEDLNTLNDLLDQARQDGDEPPVHQAR